MNPKAVTSQLKQNYPHKSIFKNDANNPTEIICELEPTTDHPEYSKAIAVIDRSIPHYHTKTTETYTVIKGQLTVHVKDQTHQLKEGQSITIKPGNVHWAEGNEVWVECYSEPGWTPKDHKIVK